MFSALLCSSGLAQPRAALPHANFDFGYVGRGSVVRRDFVVRNVGTEPLRIYRIGMTPPLNAGGSLPGIIPPGSQASLKFLLDTNALNGMYQGAIQLFLNDPNLPVANLRFAGMVQSTIDVLPAPMLQVLARRGYGGRSSVEIVNREPQPLAIQTVEHPADRFTTSLETIEPGRRYRLSISLKPDGPSGEAYQEIVVRTTSRTMPVLRVIAHTAIYEVLRVEPGRLDLGTLSLASLRGNPAMARKLVTTLTVHGIAGADIAVLARTELDFLKLGSPPGPNGRYQIAVRVVRERLKPGPFRGTITISSTHPSSPKLRVPVQGTVAEK